MTARSDFCLFRHGTETWACSTQVAGEIIEWRPHTTVPRAPGALRGALNLRGEILPLLSLDEFLLGKSSTVERRGSMLVLAAESVRIAAEVDAVVAVRHIAPWEIRTPEHRDAPIPGDAPLRGIVHHEDHRTIVLDAPALVARIADSIRTEFQHATPREKEEPWPAREL